MQSEMNHNNRLDKMGIAVATVCAIHCVFLPLLIPVLPLVGLSFIGEHVFEDIVLVISLVVGFIALYTGYQRYHKRLYPIYCLALGGLIYAFKDSVGEMLHIYFIGIGAALIVFAHVMNVKLCRSCKCC